MAPVEPTPEQVRAFQDAWAREDEQQRRLGYEAVQGERTRAGLRAVLNMRTKEREI